MSMDEMQSEVCWNFENNFVWSENMVWVRLVQGNNIWKKKELVDELNFSFI